MFEMTQRWVNADKFTFLMNCPFDCEGKNVSVPFSEWLKSHTAQSHLLGGGLKLSLKCDFCVFNRPILREILDISSAFLSTLYWPILWR